MRILIINGPNLNLLGKRNPEIYGNRSFESFFDDLCGRYQTDIELTYHQTNHEGQIIDWLQDADGQFDGIVLNAGGYTHTSIAIADAIEAIQTPVVEVHISDISKREIFRKHSFLTPVCKKTIMGLGLEGYARAIEYFIGEKK